MTWGNRTKRRAEERKDTVNTFQIKKSLCRDKNPFALLFMTWNWLIDPILDLFSCHQEVIAFSLMIMISQHKTTDANDDHHVMILSWKSHNHQNPLLLLQERRDFVTSHSSSLGPITSLSGSSAFGSGGRLSHGPSSSDFQPPYFPPPYNPQPDFHHAAAHVNAVVAAASDPYSHLNSLGNPQQYHQLHPASQGARGHNVLSRRDEDTLSHIQSHHMHSSGLPTSVYSDVNVSNISAARRGAEMVYSSVRRPDVLMHGGHHAISEQDLLNMHNGGGALSELADEGQVCHPRVMSHFIISFSFCSTSCISTLTLQTDNSRDPAIFMQLLQLQNSSSVIRRSSRGHVNTFRRVMLAAGIFWEKERERDKMRRVYPGVSDGLRDTCLNDPRYIYIVYIDVDIDGDH